MQSTDVGRHETGHDSRRRFKAQGWLWVKIELKFKLQQPAPVHLLARVHFDHRSGQLAGGEEVLSKT